MHVITGGAYNGKASWVRETYDLKYKAHTWLSAYDNEACPHHLSIYKNDTIILEGVEQWIRQKLLEKGSTFSRYDGKVVLNKWLSWEQANKAHQLIVIGSDISKGIVPLKQSERQWRDVTGWFYQDLVNRAKRYDVIWYGIHQQLK